MCSCLASSQDTLKVMNWNLLNYADGGRDQYYRTVIRHVKPDVLVVEEMTSQAMVDAFFNSVINVVFPGQFSKSPFVNGPDTDNELYYKTAKFSFISNTPVHTALRDISEFKLYNAVAADTLCLYAVHLKASSGGTNETLRAAEVDSVRKVTNALPNGKFFIICGDFNIYGSTELAYQKLLQDNPGDDGHFVDALNLPGTWNDSSYRPYHTQSPRVRSFGGGATGGMDDRFDMILYSRAVSQPGRIHVLAGSLTPIGNDGQHYNDSINQLPNTAVPDSVANALHYASDHLPVSMQFVFSGGGGTVAFQSRIILRDNGGLSDSLEYGTGAGSTDGIDAIFGEYELPPLPPSGVLDVRWRITGTLGTKRNIRDTLGGTHVQNIYTGLMQPGEGGYPFVLRWNRLELPAGTFTLRDEFGGIFFQVNMKLQDSLVVADENLTAFQIVYGNGSTVNSSVPSGWSIVSLPVSMSDRRKTQVFPTSSSTAFAFTPTGYANRDTLDYGKGYWLKFPSAQPLSLSGGLRTLDTISVSQGWNIIGSISSAVPVGSIIQIPSSIVTSLYFGYSTTGYAATTSIDPMSGYWVKVNQNGFLVLKAPSDEALKIYPPATFQLVPVPPNAHENSTTGARPVINGKN